MIEAELVIAEVQRPDGAHITKKHEMAQHNIQPAASALTGSVWKHASNKRSKLQLYSNFDC